MTAAEELAELTAEAEAELPPKRDCLPLVFVHGLAGWGEGTKINRIMP
ncbi:MAG: hypothetical protein LBR73_06780 [Oscillospiraceae bacterium]|jgi:hypothetical protein|nr:hypothetical protein [Oscillospiraceae bacterium]